jgi:hypothetical protein
MITSWLNQKIVKTDKLKNSLNGDKMVLFWQTIFLKTVRKQMFLGFSNPQRFVQTFYKCFLGNVLYGK